MRVETVAYQGNSLHGFELRETKLAVARLADRNVKIVSGPEARLAIDIMQTCCDPEHYDRVLGQVAGEFRLAADARAAISPDAKALALK